MVVVDEIKTMEFLKEVGISSPGEGHIYGYKLYKDLYGDRYEEKYDLNHFVEGSGDGGFDFYSLYLNGELINIDECTKKISKGNQNNLEINLYQVKYKKKIQTGITLSEDFLQNIKSILDDVYNYSIGKLKKEELILNPRIQKLVELMKECHINLEKIDSIELNFIYLPNALYVDEKNNDTLIKSEESNIKRAIKSLYGKVCEYNFKLITKPMYQEYKFKKNKLSLKLSHKSNNFIGTENKNMIFIINGEELLKFISSNHPSIKDMIASFYDDIAEDNVRAALPKNETGEKIKKSFELTVADETNEYSFWVLHNGLTVLAEKIEYKANGNIQLSYPQIINGLQTITKFKDYIIENINTITIDDIRKIEFIVKIVTFKTNDESSKERLILSSNSQNKISYVDLISVNKYIKALESKLEIDKVDYRRKKNQPRKEPKKDFINFTNMEMLQLISMLMWHGPSEAKNRLKEFVKLVNFDSIIKQVLEDDYYERLLNCIKTYHLVRYDMTINKVAREHVIYKYAKLQVTYFLFVRNITPTTTNILNLLDEVKKCFNKYSKDTGLELNYYKLSKNIPASYLEK